MTGPCFDECVEAGDIDWQTLLVIHRNAEGKIVYIHSPLDGTKQLVCEICYSGARVTVRVPE